MFTAKIVESDLCGPNIATAFNRLDPLSIEEEEKTFRARSHAERKLENLNRAERKTRAP